MAGCTEKKKCRRVAVIDGQGGGIGQSLVAKIKEAGISGVEIVALGTNSAATARMMKAGAHCGATGENAVIFNVGRVDVIMGVISVLSANSMLGEISPAMAMAIGASPAHKILIPVSRCNIEVVHTKDSNLGAAVEAAASALAEFIGRE